MSLPGKIHSLLEGSKVFQCAMVSVMTGLRLVKMRRSVWRMFWLILTMGSLDTIIAQRSTIKFSARHTKTVTLTGKDSVRKCGALLMSTLWKMQKDQIVSKWILVVKIQMAEYLKRAESLKVVLL